MDGPPVSAQCLYIRPCMQIKRKEATLKLKHTHAHTPITLSWCCVTCCHFPHVILCVPDLLLELLRQNHGPLQTLGLQVQTAAVYADQINWTHTMT